MNETNHWQHIDRPGEGQAICFDLLAIIRFADGQEVEISEQGFITCFQGQLRAWRNSCPHAGSPLDWIPGQFFSENGEQLVCHTHGAHFDPLSGACLSGPCPRGLFPLEFKATDEGIQVPVSVQVVQ